MADYVVLSDSSSAALEAQVVAKMGDGYNCQGGLVVVSGTFYQAMVQD